MKTEIVYGLHFMKPLSDTHTSQHYLGSCLKENFHKRLKLHRKGQSYVPYIREYTKKNISFVVFATWDGDRVTERQLKNRKNTPRLCPICRTMRRAK